MVNEGMPVDIVNNYGNTALMRAADGFTALHFASFTSNTDVIRMLLRHGASRDIKSKNGKTPIECTRGMNKEEAVRLLQ